MLKTFLYFTVESFAVVYDAIMCTVVIMKPTKTSLLLKQGNQNDFLKKFYFMNLQSRVDSGLCLKKLKDLIFKKLAGLCN